MNILTILIGLVISFYGFHGILMSRYRPRIDNNIYVEDTSDLSIFDKLEYYANTVERRKCIFIMRRVSEFLISVAVFYIGVNFILAGVKGVSVVPLLDEFVSFIKYKILI